MFGIGQAQLLILGVVALLLFGNKLPSVARSLGKSLTEFKKGMTGVEDEFRSAMHEADRAAIDHDREAEDHAPSAPKFVPPSSPPKPS